jgi:hypothetical protein
VEVNLFLSVLRLHVLGVLGHPKGCLQYLEKIVEKNPFQSAKFQAQMLPQTGIQTGHSGLLPRRIFRFRSSPELKRD